MKHIYKKISGVPFGRCKTKGQKTHSGGGPTKSNTLKTYPEF